MKKDRSQNEYGKITFKKDFSDLRKKKFEPLIRDFIANFILHDNYLNLLQITLTKTDVSKDLKNCKVFLRFLNLENILKNKNIAEEDKKYDDKVIIKLIQQKLNSYSEKISQTILKEFNLRSRVNIKFFYDDLLEKLEIFDKNMHKMNENLKDLKFSGEEG